MAATYILIPRQANTDVQDSQHLYFIAAAAIIFSLITLRIVLLRKRNQSLSEFFRLGPTSHPYGSYPPYDSNHGSMYHGIQLASPPAAYHPDRRVRAADTDTQGRRLGASGEASGKDLPPYDNFDRPPKYMDAYGGPPPFTEQSAVTSSPSGGEGGTGHTETASGERTA